MAKPAAKIRAQEHQNYIGGEWQSPESGKYIENRSPADTRDLVGLFPDSTADDANRAVSVAAEAFQKWRKVPAPRRAEILFKAGEILIGRKEDCAVDMTREMGKVLKEARGDVQEAIDMTYFIAGEGRRLHGYTTPAEMPNKFAMCSREPVGVCGLITPWNFPMAIPSWKIIPALVCGNTVVIKPAEDTPLSTYNLVSALEEAGVPPGVLNHRRRHGESRRWQSAARPSSRFGWSRSRARPKSAASSVKRARRRDKICSLEMGGKNVIIDHGRRRSRARD